MEEEQQFAANLSQIEPEQQEQIMEIVTSWMRKGIEQGREEGMYREARELALRQLRKRLGAVIAETETRIGELSLEQLENLGEALLDFTSPSDLNDWLESHS